jgi:hypothetical protein
LLVLVGWSVSSHSAADTFTFTLPAGQACPDFDLKIDLTTPDHRVMKTFFDANGNPVRYLAAGQGNKFVFSNAADGFSLSVKTGGSVEHITPNADGTQTWVTTGHELVILFPTDSPPGPATILYIGRLVFNLDPATFTFLGMQSFTGKSTDICATLSN